MLLYNVRQNNHGFTIIETLTILIIIGILSAIAAPSFLSLFNRNKVSGAIEQLQSSLQEAQREAIRRNKACTVYLPDATQAQLISDCFITSDGTSTGILGVPNGLAIKKMDKMSIISNFSSNPKKITFSFKGNTIVDLPVNVDYAIIVLFSSDTFTQKKTCLVTSNGIGIMRNGKYNGSTTAADITINNCTSE